MKNRNKIRIAKIHICSFEKVNDKDFKFNVEKYPERLCVIDENRDIVVDVETKHEYPYVETTSTLHFINNMYINQISEGQRVACYEYVVMLPNQELSSKEIDECNKIFNLLKQGKSFKKGNEELTNEEYLEMINKAKVEPKIKKLFKKGK